MQTALPNAALAYHVRGNSFAYPAVLNLPDALPLYRQLGIKSIGFANSNILPRGNYFTNLHEGLYLQIKYGKSITENEFNGCVYGIHLVGPGEGDPTDRIQLQCNTFYWPATARFGRISPRGIFIGPNYPVTLTGIVPLNPTPTASAASLLKNYFLHDTRVSITDVWNDPSNAPFDYDTFQEVISGSAFLDPLTSSNVNVTNSQPMLTISRSNDCANDGYPSAGIQARTTKSNSSSLQALSNLETLAPNPAAGRTVAHYLLAPNDAGQPAKLVVRSLLSGAVVQEVVLSGAGTEAVLPTQELPNGVYAVSLLVNGRFGATRRLLVNH